MIEKLRHIILLVLKKRIFFPLLGILLLIFAIVSIDIYEKKDGDDKQYVKKVLSKDGDLVEILQKGKLKVFFENSSVSFFIYKGKKMGLEYELLKEFANDLGVELEIVIIDNLDDVFQELNAGSADLLACNLTYTKARSKEISYSIPFYKTKQVLIQRKPKDWRKMKPSLYLKSIINDPSQLANKKIRIWGNSSYLSRLENLQNEIGDTIYIEKASGELGEEELIEMVAEGLIDFTVCDENIAMINKRFYENIDCHLALSVKQKIGFGVRKSSVLLKAKLDEWLESYMKTTSFKYIKHKYYNIASFTHGINKNYSSLSGNMISVFDEYFKKAQEKYGWDWRLVASLCYQESRFNPDVISFGGAFSMMQFMPEIGPIYGVYPDSPPEIQIMGGAKKLKKDFDSWKEITDVEQRYKFTIATYNSGKSHVLDARRLAEKYGLNPNIWDDNVEKMMLNLSKREYYKDPLVKSGAAKGSVTCNYVKEIYNRYLVWKAVYN